MAGEIWNKRKNKDVYPQWLTINVVKDADGRLTNYIATISGITERKQIEDRLHSLTHYDTLTGLPNRELFNMRLKEAIQRTRQNNSGLALLFIDLDRFKTVNDSLGHNAGDELLQQAAAHVKQSVRESDLAARFGGDEFTVILENITDPQKTQIVAQKIIQALSLPINLRHHQVFISPSIGIAFYPSDATEIKELIKLAVNISVRQHRLDHLVPLLDTIIGETQVDPSCLELEITASIMIENLEATLQIFEALHARRIRISIDDFGTGYSSSSYLQRLPNHESHARAFLDRQVATPLGRPDRHSRFGKHRHRISELRPPGTRRGKPRFGSARPLDRAISGRDCETGNRARSPRRVAGSARRPSETHVAG